MTGTMAVSDIISTLEGFRKSDAARESLITELVQQYQTLQVQYHDKCVDLEEATETRRMWSSRAIAAENMNKQAAANSFVLVILDGDGAIFRDDLYAQGKDGGAEAAHVLHTEIQKQLEETYPDQNISEWNILVSIFLNLEGLSKTLYTTNLISSPNDLPAFGRSFGLTQPLFNFIDVGVGKERADHKVRETLRTYWPITQCKHIYFGPCHDTGYLPVLEPYKRDALKSGRITLIETRPAEPGFLDLGIKRVRFPTLFRKDDIPKRLPPTPIPAAALPTRSAFSPMTNLPPARAAARSTSPTLSTHPEPTSNGSTWATVSRSGSIQNVNVAPKKTAAKAFILLNTRDERVDNPLLPFNASAEARFKESTRTNGNYCNEFHLKGTCPSGPYCNYQHGDQLSPGEKLILTAKARGRPCGMGSECRDIHCSFGHQCKFGRTCGLSERCKFVDMHAKDITPAKKLFEDGSEIRL